MPVFKRELAFQAQGPMAETGDWWHLVLDTDVPGLYVEHTQMHAKAHSEDVSAGTQRFGINDFLTLAESQLARAVLIDALKEIFRDANPS
jgi:hypothetical protein